MTNGEKIEEMTGRKPFIDNFGSPYMIFSKTWWDAEYKEREPQGEFTDLEKELTADAINYLLGAELLEENGYTEEVINALKSVLQKIGAEEDHL